MVSHREEEEAMSAMIILLLYLPLSSLLSQIYQPIFMSFATIIPV